MQGNSSAAPAVMTGTVVWFDSRKGYGFVAADCVGRYKGERCGKPIPRGSDVCPICGAGVVEVFVHYSALSGPPGRRNLNQDQRVEFERVAGPKGPMAHAVKICLPEGK